MTGSSRPRGPPSQDAQKPTAISLLKGGGVTKACVLSLSVAANRSRRRADRRLVPRRPVNRKIAALEAKLAAMRQNKDGFGLGSATASPTGSATPPPVGAVQEGGAEASGSGRAGTSATASIDHAKAGLPARPYFTALPERSHSAPGEHPHEK